MGPVPFYLDVTNRKVQLVVDGEEITEKYPIRRIGFEIAAGAEPAKLFIEVQPGGGVIKGEAIVHQLIEPTDQRESVLAFLANIDPGVLEATALGRFGLLSGESDSETTGQAFLAALVEMAAGNGH